MHRGPTLLLLAALAMPSIGCVSIRSEIAVAEVSGSMRARSHENADWEDVSAGSKLDPPLDLRVSARAKLRLHEASVWLGEGFTGRILNDPAGGHQVSVAEGRVGVELELGATDAVNLEIRTPHARVRAVDGKATVSVAHRQITVEVESGKALVSSPNGDGHHTDVVREGQAVSYTASSWQPLDATGRGEPQSLRDVCGRDAHGGGTGRTREGQ